MWTVGFSDTYCGEQGNVSGFLVEAVVNRGMTDRKGKPDDELETLQSRDILDRLFRDGRTNALLSWVLVGILALALVESILDPDYQWMVFVAAAGIIVLIPTVTHRDWRVMLPWELLVLALLPIVVRALFRGNIGTFGAYIAIAALALIVTVELHMFTALTVTHWFAVALVVLTTLASVVVGHRAVEPRPRTGHVVSLDERCPDDGVSARNARRICSRTVVRCVFQTA